MIIFVYGEDTYSSQQQVLRMRDQFKVKFDKSGMNFVEFPIGDKNKIEFGDVIQASMSPPFLSEKRMVIVRGLTATLKKKEAQPWIENLKKVSDSTILVLWDSESVKKIERTELFKSMKDFEGVHVYPHAFLTGRELTNWAEHKVQDLSLKITVADLNKVIAMVGNDLWQLSGELEKLAARAGGEMVSEKMILNLVKANFEDQIFAFIDAVSQKNSRRAIQLLDSQRQSGSLDFQLFAMLARQVRILLGVRSMIDQNQNVTKGEVASVLKVHPFVAQKSLSQARGMSFEDLSVLHEMLFDFDKKMKTGGIDPELAVDRLVLQMVGENA